MLFFFPSIKKQVKRTQNETSAIISQKGGRLGFSQEVGNFVYGIPEAFRYIFRDPEILLFSFLQCLVVGAAYFLWVEFFDWVPHEVEDNYKAAREANQDTRGMYIAINIAFALWSFFIVWIASYPLALLNAAMISSVNLRESNQNSTIWRCLMLASNNIYRMWAFMTIDSWVTVTRIFDRIPGGNKSIAKMAAEETLYYAWKLGTAAVMPALVNGRDLFGAGRDSIKVLKSRFWEVSILRFGYSGFSWVIGVSAYIGSMYFYWVMSHHLDSTYLYDFYKLMGIPLFVAVGVLTCFVRPFYMVMLAHLYFHAIPLEKVDASPTWKGSFALMLFIAMLIGTIFSIVYSDELGIRQYIETLAARG